MPEQALILLDRFQLALVPALPHTLAGCFRNGQGQAVDDDVERSPDVVSLLTNDAVLWSRLLLSAPDPGKTPMLSAAGIRSTVSSDNINGLAIAAALACSFTDISSVRLNFLKLQWRYSFLTAAISVRLAEWSHTVGIEQAGFSGLFANIGELMLESLFHEQYLALHEDATDDDHLVRQEKQIFGASHPELGAVLLERWGLDAFVCDALRYHQEPLTRILDASGLVRLVWLANAMAGLPVLDDAVVEAGAELLQINKKRLMKIHEQALAALTEHSAWLNLQFPREKRFPLRQKKSAQGFSPEDEELLRRLAEEVKDINFCNSLAKEFSAPATIRELDQAVRQVLIQTLGLASYAILVPGKDKTLSVLTGSLAADKSKELKISCQPGRGLVASAWVCASSQNSFDNQDMSTVVDGQLASLLKSNGLLCEPLLDQGRVVAVLVLGLNRSQYRSHSRQTRVRKLLADRIVAFLRLDAGLDRSGPDLQHEQKIREVIHEVNNPLSIIKNYLHLLAMKQGGQGELVEEINIIKTEIDRVGRILGRLKNDDSQSYQASTVDVNQVVKNLARVFSSSLFASRDMNLSLDLDGSLADVSGDENALKQILTNLIKNAAEAIQDEGRVSIQTHGQIFMNARQFVEIIISDDGPGIEKEILDGLFLPGRSTKDKSHSGSGLAIVKSLVERMDGFVSCRSNKNGTIFSILLPVERSSESSTVEKQRNDKKTKNTVG
ncbi:MAG: HDOD domain-containing protein [Pseudomonadales bacterium]|nr:HDOD domain-containing protein [Pseudomonadales bacterium]